MTTERRKFLKNILLFTAAAVAVPVTIITMRNSHYPIKYTVTGESDEAIQNYLSMIDSQGVRDNNRKLSMEGLIVSKTAFKKVAPKRWECTLVFRSERAFNQFLDSSRPIISNVYDFKRTHGINISLGHVS